MSVNIIMHDPIDESIPLYRDAWADVSAAFEIPHIFKVGGDQKKGFVQYGPEHSISGKFVCVMHPEEAIEAKSPIVDIVDYEFPLECACVFGPDNDIRGWQNAFEKDDTDYITINTPGNTQLFSFMAATMVLWNHWMDTR